MRTQNWLVKSLIFVLVVFISVGFSAIRNETNTKENASIQGTETKEKVFVIHAPIRDLNAFEELAKQAARLKPYGRVEINVSNLADKGFHEIPEGRNFWYEYASYNPTPYKYFPDKKIAPFIPEDFVKKNREMLLSKAKILRKYGLDAAFWSYEPNFLPDGFFETYPELLGSRVDHPRRCNQPAFAPCVSVPETQEMFSGMVEELIKNVPEIHTFFFKTNDAGSGICWSDWQYAGPNGPDHCKHISIGEKVASLMNTFKEGATRAGGDISIYLVGSMFTDTEKEDIYRNLPENCFFQHYNSDKVRGISSGVVSNYPAKGILNPLSLIGNIHSIMKESTETVFISFRVSYDRDYEKPEVMEKLFDILIDNLENEYEEGTIADNQQVMNICKQWAGEKNAETLFNAFYALDEAENYKRAAISLATGIYWGVSTRQITRPLLIKPELLTEKEEAYFLPHVFNPSKDAARLDYTDIHGAHRTLNTASVDRYIGMLNWSIRQLEKAAEGAPESQFLYDMATALKIKKSIFRSIGNFAGAQEIRDRNAEELKKEPHWPSKEPVWEGDADFQKFNNIMRDELDNTLELINILENGGMPMIAHAEDQKHEDTFLLGPDLIEQLKMKRKIMFNHWTDIEKYLTSPLK